MSEENKKEFETPKHQDKIQALDHLSLGISIVVAIAMGVGIGILMKDWFEADWLLWVGVVWGFAAAGLNVQKAYKRARKEFEGMENDPRYAYRAKHGDKSNDDD